MATRTRALEVLKKLLKTKTRPRTMATRTMWAAPRSNHNKMVTELATTRDLQSMVTRLKGGISGPFLLEAPTITKDEDLKIDWITSMKRNSRQRRDQQSHRRGGRGHGYGHMGNDRHPSFSHHRSRDRRGDKRDHRRGGDRIVGRGRSRSRDKSPEQRPEGGLLEQKRSLEGSHSHRPLVPNHRANNGYSHGHRGRLINSPSSGAEDNLLKQSIASIKNELRLELQQQLHDVDKRIEDAYKKGRQDAELKELQLWIPPVDPKLVERAKGLEFIDLLEIKASYNKVAKSKDATKERLVVDKQTGDIVVEDGASQDRDAIKWMEWQSLFADLLDLYLIHGGHLKHLPAMLSYFRLFQRMGQAGKFTFTSLQKLDRHIRSKPEGQGPNFSWRCDGTMSNVLYLDGFKESTL